MGRRMCRPRNAIGYPYPLGVVGRKAGASEDRREDTVVGAEESVWMRAVYMIGFGSLGSE